MKIIFLNGAPHSGKDTAANLLVKHFRSSTDYYPLHLKFASPLKKAAHALFGMEYHAEDAFEGEKETKTPQFAGYSPREVYIAISEQLAKPLWGKDFFGKMFVNHLQRYRRLYRELADFRHRNLVVICSDCGFLEEILPAIKAFGAQNCILIKVTRDGCDFKNDSRGYVSGNDAGIAEETIANNSTMHQLGTRLVKTLKKYL